MNMPQLEFTTNKPRLRNYEIPEQKTVLFYEE